MAKSTKKMSPALFKAIKPYLARMDEKRVEAARRVLVEGHAAKDVGEELGFTKQALNGSMNSLLRYAETYAGMLTKGTVKAHMDESPEVGALSLKVAELEHELKLRDDEILSLRKQLKSAKVRKIQLSKQLELERGDAAAD